MQCQGIQININCLSVSLISPDWEAELGAEELNSRAWVTERGSGKNNVMHTISFLDLYGTSGDIEQQILFWNAMEV